VTPPGTVVTMFTHASRLSERTRTIRAFAAVGCPVAHVQMQFETPRTARNRRNALAAVTNGARIALEVGATGVLVIEDDILPARTLRDWLAYLEATQDRAVTLYVPNHISVRTHPRDVRRWAMGNGRPPESRVATARNLPQWWGSQAIWLPLRIADRIIGDATFAAHEMGVGPWDIALRKHLERHGETLGLAIPNIVQHTGARNLRIPRKPVHRSIAFSEGAPAPT